MGFPDRFITVSYTHLHDRTLLNLLPEICELEKHQINYYGGNYEFYKDLEFGTGAVSYTHLDVYKRQPIILWRSPKEWPTS